MLSSVVYNNLVGNRINITKSIFKDNPYDRFSNKYGIPAKVWKDIYDNRYQRLQYNPSEIRDYYNIVICTRYTGIPKLSDRTIRRWIQRTELFHLLQPVIKMGVKEVSPDFFDEKFNEIIKKHK